MERTVDDVHRIPNGRQDGVSLDGWTKPPFDEKPKKNRRHHDDSNAPPKGTFQQTGPDRTLRRVFAFGHLFFFD